MSQADFFPFFVGSSRERKGLGFYLESGERGDEDEDLWLRLSELAWKAGEWNVLHLI